MPRSCFPTSSSSRSRSGRTSVSSPGEGPRLTPRLIQSGLEELSLTPARLDPIYETVRKVRAELDPSKTLIGFAGAPWTVATYMVAGEGSREQSETRRLAYLDPGQFAAIVERIEQVTFDYLVRARSRPACRSGPIVRQLGGKPCPGRVRALGDRADGAARRPVEGEIPGRAGNRLSQGSRRQARRLCPRNQGRCCRPRRNRRPGLGRSRNCPRACPSRAISILSRWSPPASRSRLRSRESAKRSAARPHIFNLGHGILQDTPIAHVEELIASVKGGA